MLWRVAWINSRRCECDFMRRLKKLRETVWCLSAIPDRDTLAFGSELGEQTLIGNGIAGLAELTAKVSM